VAAATHTVEAPQQRAERPARAAIAAPVALSGVLARSPSTLLQVQRSAGNRALGGLLRATGPRRLARCGAGGCTCGGKCGGKGQEEELLEHLH
jgi:hypothetical protein